MLNLFIVVRKRGLLLDVVGQDEDDLHPGAHELSITRSDTLVLNLLLHPCRGLAASAALRKLLESACAIVVWEWRLSFRFI
jgi:hypothetical protein